MTFWHDFFASYQRGSAPLWVTEHGYPADTAYQDDPRYRGGETAQAAFLRDSLPTLLRAGAAQIFVSTRDSYPEEFGPASPFNSEGVANVSDDAPYSSSPAPGLRGRAVSGQPVATGAADRGRAGTPDRHPRQARDHVLQVDGRARQAG